MKRMLLIVIAALCLLCGCQAEQKEPPAQAVEPFTYTSSVLYFIEGETIQAVDTEGRLIEVDNPQQIKLPEGSRGENVEIQVHADGQATLTLDYPYSFASIHPLRAASEDAPEAFARQALEEMLGNSIWDYTLKEVAVVNQMPHRIDFLMTYDLVVSRNATEFGAYSPFSGTYGQGTLLTDQKRAISILGNGQQWMSYDPVYFGDRQRLAVPEYADFTPTEQQTVLFATPQAVYYQEKTYLPQSAEDEDNGVPREYDTALWSWDRNNGQRRQLMAKALNHDFSFQDYKADKIYLNAYFWEPYSESFPGGLYVIDETSGQARQLQDLSLTVAMTDEAIYTLQTHFEQDYWAADLYAVEQSTAKMRHICAIPDQSLGEDMRRFTVSGQTMRMYHYDFDNKREIFEINLLTGAYQQIE